MLNVVCLESNNYLGLGQVYVTNLRRAVAFNLSGYHRFICFTDCADREPGSYVLPHPGFKGFYNKLALFKPGLFPEGERILYLDLDTVIAGPLDDIAAYDGEFAMLEDLWFPGLKASGVMAWRAGFGRQIWESYLAAGLPTDVRHKGYNFGGDGAWISQHAPDAEVLQDLYPGQIVSYKDRVQPGVLTPQARIVCFHGQPRPHEVAEGWVPKLWKGTDGLPC